MHKNASRLISSGVIDCVWIPETPSTTDAMMSAKNLSRFLHAGSSAKRPSNLGMWSQTTIVCPHAQGSAATWSTHTACDDDACVRDQQIQSCTPVISAGSQFTEIHTFEQSRSMCLSFVLLQVAMAGS
jgi:hypothetical protein